jgi:hypothetical protein
VGASVLISEIWNWQEVEIIPHNIRMKPTLLLQSPKQYFRDNERYKIGFD